LQPVHLKLIKSGIRSSSNVIATWKQRFLDTEVSKNLARYRSENNFVGSSALRGHPESK